MFIFNREYLTQDWKLASALTKSLLNNDFQYSCNKYGCNCTSQSHTVS